MTAVLEMHGVTRTYGSPPTDALRGVDLTVDDGEFVAVVGPSGSGKSTMLNLMGTLDRPSSGSISIGGESVEGATDARLSAIRAHMLGFVFQQFHLADSSPAIDNVADGLLYTGEPRSQRRRRAAVALASVGLDHRLRHRPRQLSGGERQRVAIARAIVREPTLLLADEPTGSLDSASGAVVMDVLRTLNEAGTTIVLITHDQALAASLPRRVHVRDGRITDDEHGTTEHGGMP